MSKPMSLDELVELQGKFLNEINANGKEIVASAFTPFFEQYPMCAVRWVQYTPYFNDGDACEFCVHEFSLGFYENDVPLQFQSHIEDAECECINDADGENVKVYWFESYLFSREHSNHPILKAFETLERNLHRVPDLLELTFGDHAQIYATKGKFDVAEYDHE